MRSVASLHMFRSKHTMLNKEISDVLHLIYEKSLGSTLNVKTQENNANHQDPSIQKFD